MTHKTITLTGWGQPYDALAAIAPHAEHIDYTHIANIEQAMQHIAHRAHDAACVVGWSMGGAIACQMVARGMLAPKKLVLMAASFQFVETPQLKLGMTRPIYDQFVDNYRRNPVRTLNKAYQLIAHGDKEHLRVQKALTEARAKLPDYDWLYWLEALERLSAVHLDFSSFPETEIIHGMNDVVADVKNTEYFKRAIPHAQVMRLPDCGHAPHWHGAAIHV